MRLKSRVEALEQTTGGELKCWHRVHVDVGQPVDAAVAAYEAENGPIGDDNVILRTIFDPHRMTT